MVSFFVLMVVALTGCSSATTGGGTGATPPATSAGGSAGTGGTTIAEQNYAFSPNAATVKVGDTVTFTNNDSVPHNVKIDGQELGVQQPGEAKTWTASKDGSYPFSCIIHPAMTGVITVGAGGGSAPAGGSSSAPPAGTGGY